MLQVATAALVLSLGASTLEDVSLDFRPTDSSAVLLNDLARAFQGKKVTVQPFTDARQGDRKLVGRNTEDRKPRDVTTRDDVGAWCSGQLAELLSQAGVAVIPEGADLVISGQVTRFMVMESDVYRGVVAMSLTVKSAKGRELWTGLVTGEAKRWGRSYKEENYMETLSDSLVRALSVFATDPKLGAAPPSGAAPLPGETL